MCESYCLHPVTMSNMVWAALRVRDQLDAHQYSDVSTSSPNHGYAWYHRYISRSVCTAITVE